MARWRLDPAAVEDALAGVAPRVEALDETGSTNEDARRLAREGAPHLTTVVANAQSAGRGRLGRTWVAEPGESLLASWVVRPELPVDRWTTLPLLAGIAAAEAIEARTRVEAALKWPNDLLARDRKIGGILVEAEPPGFAIIGLGVNVSQTSFPPPLDETATSVALERGIRLDRADLLAATLRNFAGALAKPDQALARYRTRCATIGSPVRIERTGREDLHCLATGVDHSGALIVETDAGRERIASGDIFHVRPGEGDPNTLPVS